jgi:hypothetical protein
MSVSCECSVLSGRGLCDGLVPCPEESYRVWCVWVWSWSLEKWGGLGPQGAVEPLGERQREREKKSFIIRVLLTPPTVKCLKVSTNRMLPGNMHEACSSLNTVESGQFEMNGTEVAWITENLGIRAVPYLHFCSVSVPVPTSRLLHLIPKPLALLFHFYPTFS